MNYNLIQIQVSVNEMSEPRETSLSKIKGKTHGSTIKLELKKKEANGNGWPIRTSVWMKADDK